MPRESHKAEFVLLDGELGSGCVRLRFSGVFQGEAVMWDATLLTLQEAWRRAPRDEFANFIEVAGQGSAGRQVTIGLDVPAIDEATVAKAIIMLRQYKALRPGRHEYGRPRRFEGTSPR